MRVSAGFDDLAHIIVYIYSYEIDYAKIYE
jgi:hypothetical protein